MTRLLLAAVLLAALGGCQTLRPGDVGKMVNPPQLALSNAPPGLKGRELAAALISASDQRCEDYLVGVTAQRNIGNSTFSILGSGLATVGGLASEAQAANAFAAASTFASSTANTIDDTIFGTHEFAVIYDAVKRGRAVERKGFMENMSVFVGMGDQEVLSRIIPYDHNCGITYGLVELSRALQEASTRAPQLQAAADP